MTALTTVAFCVGLVTIVFAVLLLAGVVDRIIGPRGYASGGEIPGRRTQPACRCRACTDPGYIAEALADLERNLP